MSKKKIIQTVTIAALLIAVGAWFLYENMGKFDGDPLNMIPHDAALIIEIDNPANVFNKLSEGNSLWQKLLEVRGIEKINAKINSLDTLLSEESKYLQLLKDSPLTIAFFADSINTVEILILSKIESNLDIASVKRMLSSELGREYGLLDIAGIHNGFKMVNAIGGSANYFAFINGVFVYSTSSDLLVRLMETSNGKLPSLTSDSSFAKLKQTSGAKVQARIFIQYDQISELIEPLLNINKKDALLWISNFADWSEVDILLKNDELIFSGFSISVAKDKFLSSFKGQQPVKLKAFNIIPYNANTVIWLGITNFNRYFYNNNTESTARYISSKFNFDINQLIEIIGNEIVFASSADSPRSYSHNSWFIVKTNDDKKAAAILKRIAPNTGNRKVSKHKHYEINKIVNESFIPDIFGNAFSVIKNNFYTIMGDYVVFANSENSLINLINYFETGKTLDLNDNFKAFSDNISSQSNLLLYIKPGGIKGRFNEYLADDFVKELSINEKVVNSFQGVAMQVSLGVQLSFTNFYVKYSDAQHEENLALWKVQLDDEIVWGPYLVSDHQSNKQNIIVFDKRSNMYLINYNGTILWKKKLDDLPISNIFQVDYYKNGKIQYLFNTSGYIYLIDIVGNNVTGYPKKLHSKATNGIVVFDYLNNKDYRLLLAQSDKRIYNYSIRGTDIKGWNQPRTQNIVVEPVTRLLANNKDYIIISDIENEIKIVDRKGNRRIKLSGNLKKGKNSDYYVNRTNSKGIIITTDERGRLVYISSSGKLNYTDFGDFSADHFFIYEDFNGDGSKDFIFIDGNNLKVYDRFKKELFRYHFGSKITIKPSFFTFGKKQHVLGVVADKERTIYLFDNKGNIIISKGLVGETPFTVGDLGDENRINLVSAAGNVLYNYRLQ